MGTHSVDGPLCAWEEIADEGWVTLLVGNGLSINISSRFEYGSLYEEAEKAGLHGFPWFGSLIHEKGSSISIPPQQR